MAVSMNTNSIAGSPLPAATAATGTSNTTSTATSSATTNIGSTFLNLLVQELQNQDPTAPMDSTAMVGQMISLNQLDQLTSINQELGGSSSTSTSGVQQGTQAAMQSAQASTGSNSSSGTSAQAAASQALPFDPTTMLPVGYANSNAVTNALNTPLISTTLTAAQTAASTYGIY